MMSEAVGAGAVGVSRGEERASVGTYAGRGGGGA